MLKSIIASSQLRLTALGTFDPVGRVCRPGGSFSARIPACLAQHRVGGTGGGGGSIDREVALAAASQKWDSISHTDPGVATTAMVEWLKTQAAFTEEGLTQDLVVWARTQDGTYVGWCDDAYLNGPNRAARIPRR